jgi:hypothetical protein
MVVLVMRVIVCVCVFVMIMMPGIIVVPGVVMFGLVMFAILGVMMPFLAVKMIMRLMAMIVLLRLIGLDEIRVRALDHLAADAVSITTAARAAVARTAAVGTVFALFFGLAMGAFVGFDQCLPVGNRNLVIIRMDFAEGQKTVTVAAIFDEGRLQ